MGCMETIVRDLMTSPAGDVRRRRHPGRGGPGHAAGRHRLGRGDRRRQGRRHPDRARPPAGGRGRRATPTGERVRLWMTARPDVLGPDERVDAAWASLTSHHYRHLPVVEGGPLRRRRVAARPHGGGPHPAGRRDERGRAGRARGRGGGRDDDRRRPRARRASSTTGSTRRSSWPRSARSRTSGTSCSTGRAPRRGRRRRPSPRRSGGAAPCRPACAPLLPARLPQRRTARRAAHRRLAARGRARLAPDARHRCRRAATTRPSDSARSCRRFWRRRTGCGRGRSPSSRATTSASPPTTCSC